ncbi:MAG: ATP-dependent protease subunit HslV [candidate division Zixibacteria bacterium]|nr:ATP-dependent protease subunit HslV [candidate division Zixibacteria bacterium]
MQKTRSTTIIAVLHNGKAAIAGDGQVSVEDTIIKRTAMKIRTINDGKILAGYAGTAGDALALFEIFEKKLGEYSNDLQRASVELVKEWRTDKALQTLEALIAVTDGKHVLLISGNGDVVEPDDGIVAIGSGGVYALAAARAIIWANPKLTADKIARRALEIAADICVYTNNHISVETIK